MLLYRIDCSECGGPRVGQKKDDDVVPFRDACPLCDSTNFTVLADE